MSIDPCVTLGSETHHCDLNMMCSRNEIGLHPILELNMLAFRVPQIDGVLTRLT